MDDDLPIEPWFWQLIERHQPDLVALEADLAVMDREPLERFLVYYHLASERTREPWDGPFIDDSVEHLSEDGTEDLTDWIVAQGRTAWLYAQSQSADWRMMLYLAHDPVADRSNHVAEWHLQHPSNTESQWGAAKAAAMGIYYDRFGETFSELRDELFDRYDPQS